MNYNVDYFIKKFEAIPEGEWCVRFLWDSDDRHCALGFCGVSPPEITIEAHNLINLLGGHVMGVTEINDGNDPDYQQPTPKRRILAALYDIKTSQAVDEANEIIRTVYICNHKAPA